MERISFVGAGPGDPDLVTVRGRDLLEEGELVVYAGSLVNEELVEDLDCRLVDSHGVSLEEVVSEMTEAYRSGEKVVRLHSGDPSLYGAIGEQMELLDAEGVPYEVVPGVSSVFAAASVLGRELTYPGVSDSVVLTRPAGRTLEEDKLDEFSEVEDTTLAIFLAASHIHEVVEKLKCSEDTPARAVYRATWPDQRVIEGTVGDIAEKVSEADIDRSAILLIGEALEAEGERSFLYGGYASE